MNQFSERYNLSKLTQREVFNQDGGIPKWVTQILPQQHQNHNLTTEQPSYRTT